METPSAPIAKLVKTVVVDELALMCTGIAAVARLAGCDVMMTAQFARDGLDAVQFDAPQLVVLGNVVEIDAVRLTATIKAPFPAPLVLVFLAAGSDVAVGDLLAAGADGIVRRACTPDELQLAIVAVLSGERHIASSLAHAIAGAVGPDIDLTEGAGSASGFSKREREMLVFLAQGRTNRQIAEDLCLSLATVKSHLARLYMKLEVNSRHDALSAAVRLGLLI